MKKLLLIVIVLMPFVGKAQTFPLDAFSIFKLGKNSISFNSSGQLLVNGALVKGITLTTDPTSADAPFSAKTTSGKLDSLFVPFTPEFYGKAGKAAISYANLNADSLVIRLAGKIGGGASSTPTIIYSNITATTLTATWPSNGASSYQLIQATTPDLQANRVVLYAGTATTFNVTGLTAGAAYYFGVVPVYATAVTTLATSPVVLFQHTFVQGENFSSFDDNSYGRILIDSDNGAYKALLPGSDCHLYKAFLNGIPATNHIRVTLSGVNFTQTGTGIYFTFYGGEQIINTATNGNMIYNFYNIGTGGGFEFGLHGGSGTYVFVGAIKIELIN